MITFKRPRRAGAAFTLLELIVGIVILGILALLAIPTFSNVIGKSHYSALEESGGALSHDVTALAATDGKAPTVDGAAQTTGLSELPSSVTAGTPSGGQVTLSAAGYSVCVTFGTQINDYGTVSDGTCSAGGSTSGVTPANVAMTFSSYTDTNGLFYWLGTKEGTAAWSNPAGTGGMVTASASSTWSSDVPANASNRTASASGTFSTYWGANTNTGWITWDVGSVAFTPNLATLLIGPSQNGSVLSISGSADNSTWTSLWSGTVNSSGSWTSYPLSASKSYRYLRVACSGGDPNWFNVAQAEFYGNVAVTSPLAPTGLTGSYTVGTGTNLSWTVGAAPSQVTSFSIYRNGSATPIATTTSTSWTDTTLTAGQTATYTVAETTASGSSPQSKPVTVYSPGAQAIMADNPVGFYPLSEGSGTAANSVTGTGALPNLNYSSSGTSAGPAVDANLGGGSTVFSGAVGVNASNGSVPSIAGNYTVLGWENMNALPTYAGGDPTPYSNYLYYGDSGFGVRADGHLTVIYDGVSWQETGYVMPTSGWHMVAMAMTSGGAATLYVDGAPVASCSSGIYSGTMAAVAGTRAFNGSIGDAAFYNSVLSASQIQSIYNAS